MAAENKLKLLRDEGLGELCAAIRGAKQTADTAGTAVSALADAVSESLDEIDGIFTDLGQTLIDGNLPVTGWVDNTDEESKTAGYDKMYSLTTEGATVDDSARVIIYPTSEDTALACGLCPSTDVVDGAIIFYAVTVPEEAIAIHYGLVKAYTSAAEAEP